MESIEVQLMNTPTRTPRSTQLTDNRSGDRPDRRLDRRRARRESKVARRNAGSRIAVLTTYRVAAITVLSVFLSLSLALLAHGWSEQDPAGASLGCAMTGVFSSILAALWWWNPAGVDTRPLLPRIRLKKRDTPKV